MPRTCLRPGTRWSAACPVAVRSRQRPSNRRAAEKRDELAAPHSITSVARSRNESRHRESERLGGRQVDDEIELGRLLDREVGRLGAAQNPVDIAACAPEQIGVVRAIGHETARREVVSERVNRGQPRAERQGVDARVVGVDEGVGTYIERLHIALECTERGRNLLGAANFEHIDFDTKLAGCFLRSRQFPEGW